MADKNREQKKHYDEELKRHRKGEDATFPNVDEFLKSRKEEPNSTNEKASDENEEGVNPRKPSEPRRSQKTKISLLWKRIETGVITTLVASAILGFLGLIWWQYTTVKDIESGAKILATQINDLNQKYSKEDNFVSVAVIRADLQGLKDRIRLLERKIFSPTP